MLVYELKHTLSEEIVLKGIIAVEIHGLFCPIVVFIPLVLAHALTLRFLVVARRRRFKRWVHLEQLKDSVYWDAAVWHELNQR